MTTPHLSKPTLFTPAKLKANPVLSRSVTRLVNEAFYRSKEIDPSTWDNTTLRFQDESSLHVMLSEENSVIALTFDENENAEALNGQNKLELNEHATGVANKKVVACAAAVPWKGGWMKEGAETESGWEIKTVCVDGDQKYLRRGLAVQLLDSLEHYLVTATKAQLQRAGTQGEGSLTLWILAAECLTGVYWRKRGYHEVRRRTEGAGTWSCRTSFDMLVLKKIVTFDIDTGRTVEKKA